MAWWCFVAFRRSIRFLLGFSAFFAVALLCLLLTSRWWLPPVLPSLAGYWGVELVSAERVEEGRLRLSGLAMDLGAEGSMAIDQAELPFEWRYLRERFSGEWSAASTLRIGQVRVSSGPKREAASSSDSGQVFLPQVHEQISAVLAVADSWLPRIEVARIEYRDADEGIAFAEDIAYEARRLSGQIGSGSPCPDGAGGSQGVRDGRAPAHAYAELGRRMPSGPWKLTVALPEVGLWRVDFSEADWGLAGSLELSGSEEAVLLEARLAQSQSEAQFTGRFGNLAWLPMEARLTSEGFDLSWLPLPESEDYSLSSLQLDKVQVHWDSESYQFSTAGWGLMQVPEAMDQRVAFELSGRGDLERLQLEVAELLAPMGSLKLSVPLGLDFQTRQFSSEAKLRAEVDLAQLPWLEAEGRVEAELRVEAAALDRLHFELQGQELAYADFSVRQIKAHGWLDFEQLTLEDASLIPVDNDAGDKVHLAGTVGWKSRNVDLSYNAQLGADWTNQMLGQELLVAALEIEAGLVRGPWTSPEVRGKLRTTLQAEAIEPIRIAADLRWDGRDRLDWVAELQSKGAAIDSAGSVLREDEAWTLGLDSLRWLDPQRPELRLQSPSSLRWSTAGGSLEESLSIADLSLRGQDLELSANYAPAEGLSLNLQNVSLARLQPWLRAELPVYRVESVVCELRQFRPYLLGEVSIAVEEQLDEDASARLELSADLRVDALAVRELRLLFSGDEVLQGAFELPLQLHLPSTTTTAAKGAKAKQTYYTLGDGALTGKLRGQSSPAFVHWLQVRTGLRMGETSLDLAISGDLSKPVGHLQLEAVAIEIGPGLFEKDLPPVEALDLRVRLDAKRIEVQALNFSLNQSVVRTGFSFPVEALLTQLKAAQFDPMHLLHAASGKVQLNAWKMEDWLDWLPPYFRRTGVFSGSLSLAPDLHLTGELDFQDFGLRPTATLASIDQIAGRLRLEDRRMQIEEASARFGGSRLSVDGEVNVADFSRPRWFFEVKGESLPILRTTEMILRSDVDLRLDASDPDVPPLVSGQLDLRSSTLLLEIDPLAPRLQRGSAARPPFFSITEAPFADWRFDLKVFGDHFMRVRSPYFRARLSADFELTGTFAEPLLLGSVRASEAEVNFPGAKFLIDEGEALIEASRPNEMQLAFNGIALKASRVIVMEVSQTLEDPLIQFESTPSMSQVEIVRLLATGSTTGGGMGNLGLYLGRGMLGAGGLNEGLTDRLSIDIGQQTSRSGRKTIDTRYQLSPRWSAEGGYDVFDAYNADLIWTIFKR
ncbi:MAG: translocation/assembly module TamB domain-containing protein [Opitutales bacterium]